MSKPSNFEKKIASIQFGYKPRRDFYNQMISLTGAGVSKVDALRMMWDVSSLEGKKPKEAVPIIISDIVERLQGGSTLGQAMKPWIPQDEFMAIEAVEDSSDFSGNLQEYLDLAAKQKSIRGKIVGGLMYPLFLFAIVIGVIYYFGVSVVPVLSGIMPPEKWSGVAYLLYLLSVFATEYLLWVVGAIGLMAPIIVFSFPRWTGNLRIYADKLPFYSTYRMYTGISFLTSVAALAKSGMSITSSIERIRVNANPYVRVRVDRILRRMLDGENFGSAMYRAGTGWPDATMSLNIKVFAETQDLTVQMSRMAREWLNDSEKAVEANMAMLRNFAMIAMFGVIMTIVGGIFGINMQLSSGAF